jgi:hypothetical protein
LKSSASLSWSSWVSDDGRHAGGRLDAGSVERARECQDRQHAAPDAHL